MSVSLTFGGFHGAFRPVRKSTSTKQKPAEVMKSSIAMFYFDFDDDFRDLIFKEH